MMRRMQCVPVRGWLSPRHSLVLVSALATLALCAVFLSTVLSARGSAGGTGLRRQLLASAAPPKIAIKFGCAQGDNFPGYFGDFGLAFGHQRHAEHRPSWREHQTGSLWFGWNSDHSSAARRPTETAPKMNSIHVQLQERDSEWAISVPNGEYQVTVTFGNPQAASLNTIQVEDVVFVKQLALDAGEIHSASAIVTVNFSYLKLTAGCSKEYGDRCAAYPRHGLQVTVPLIAIEIVPRSRSYESLEDLVRAAEHVESAREFAARKLFAGFVNLFTGLPWSHIRFPIPQHTVQQPFTLLSYIGPLKTAELSSADVLELCHYERGLYNHAHLGGQVNALVFSKNARSSEWIASFGLKTTTDLEVGGGNIPTIRGLFRAALSSTQAKYIGLTRPDVLFSSDLQDSLVAISNAISNAHARLFVYGTCMSTTVSSRLHFLNVEDMIEKVNNLHACGQPMTSEASYFFFSRPLWEWSDIPPLVLGGAMADSWLLSRAASEGSIIVIDASNTIECVQQRTSEDSANMQSDEVNSQIILGAGALPRSSAPAKYYTTREHGRIIVKQRSQSPSPTEGPSAKARRQKESEDQAERERLERQQLLEHRRLLEERQKLQMEKIRQQQEESVVNSRADMAMSAVHRDIQNAIVTTAVPTTTTTTLPALTVAQPVPVAQPVAQDRESMQLINPVTAAPFGAATVKPVRVTHTWTTEAWTTPGPPSPTLSQDAVLEAIRAEQFSRAPSRLRFKFASRPEDDLPYYVPDFGLPFKRQIERSLLPSWMLRIQESLSYGWNFDHSANIRRWDRVNARLKARATLMFSKSEWALAVPAGDYVVNVTFGDMYSATFNNFRVGGVSVATDLVLKAGEIQSRSVVASAGNGLIVISSVRSPSRPAPCTQTDTKNVIEAVALVSVEVFPISTIFPSVEEFLRAASSSTAEFPLLDVSGNAEAAETSIDRQQTTQEFAMFGCATGDSGDPIVLARSHVQEQLLARRRRALKNWAGLGSNVATVLFSTNETVRESARHVGVRSFVSDFPIDLELKAPSFRGLFQSMQARLGTNSKLIGYAPGEVLFTSSLQETLQAITRFAVTQGLSRIFVSGQSRLSNIPPSVVFPEDPPSMHKAVADIYDCAPPSTSNVPQYFFISPNLWSWADQPELVVGSDPYPALWFTHLAGQLDGVLDVDCTQTVVSVEQGLAEYSESRRNARAFSNLEKGNRTGGFAWGHSSNMRFFTERDNGQVVVRPRDMQSARTTTRAPAKPREVMLARSAFVQSAPDQAKSQSAGQSASRVVSAVPRSDGNTAGVASPLEVLAKMRAAQKGLRIKFGSIIGDDFEDYVPDYGTIFKHQNTPATSFSWMRNHKSHLWFGWNTDSSPHTHRRADLNGNFNVSFALIREREDEWAIALPNGEYMVTAIIGDRQSNHRATLQIEDLTLASQMMLSGELTELSGLVHVRKEVMKLNAGSSEEYNVMADCAPFPNHGIRVTVPLVALTIVPYTQTYYQLEDFIRASSTMDSTSLNFNTDPLYAFKNSFIGFQWTQHPYPIARMSQSKPFTIFGTPRPLTVGSLRGTHASSAREAHLRAMERSFYNWAHIGPNVNVLVFSEDTRTREWAESFGLLTLGNLEIESTTRTPNLRSMFLSVISHSVSDLVGYANFDLLFSQTLQDTLEAVLKYAHSQGLSKVFATGRRTDAYLSGRFQFMGVDDIHRKVDNLARCGRIAPDKSADYFFTSRTIWNWNSVPEFVVGGEAADMWLLSRARENPDVLDVDCTATVHCVHQMHDPVFPSGSNPRTAFNADLSIRSGGHSTGGCSRLRYYTTREHGQIVVKRR
eukprot:m.325294 g.325294  ORF g.325294 m.325294 type:complete len:1814 (+) comp55556_c0_seq2:170-5611(+)